jgi:flagellar biosynthesis/type III secretory pathway chaperone
MGPRDLLTALVSSLHEESDALVAGDTEHLSAIVQRKSDLLTRLSPQLRQLQHGDSPLDRVQLRQAQLMNSVNGRLLSARMLANGGRLDVLVRAARGETVYDADGGVSTAVGPAAARAAA